MLSKVCFIGKSAWFHVNGTSSSGQRHVIPDELDLLHAKIDALRSAQYMGEIYVISPFKAVANTCAGRFRHTAGVSCGTIHRFQGKEADVVFLVLGGDPTSSGARNWASSKPNMLNVALTRAKKRVYVIGNKDKWAACRYFDVMAAELK